MVLVGQVEKDSEPPEIPDGGPIHDVCCSTSDVRRSAVPSIDDTFLLSSARSASIGPIIAGLSFRSR